MILHRRFIERADEREQTDHGDVGDLHAGVVDVVLDLDLAAELRLQGASYEDIARAGGGIRSTVAATRAACIMALASFSAAKLAALPLARGS